MQNAYRSHYCGEINENQINEKIKIAGWVEAIRDHGGVIFLEIRDFTGIVQVVINDAENVRNLTRESSVTISGAVAKRSEANINSKIKTGTIEIKCENLTILGKAQATLPFEINESEQTKEELRLKYRYLDLRNRKIYDKIVMRSKIINFLRNKMNTLGFLEIQTPILAASSPEGARDYLIPSRKHHGKFYALPQAPQQFKQLLMVAGFDKYFQIAPCFRDEDSRADRSPGEFYQLDFEMSFAAQEDVLQIGEEILYDTFFNFTDKKVTKMPFPRMTFANAMLKYGTDKPDLRNPLEIIDVTDIFENSGFAAFERKTIRSITVPNCAAQPRKFFDNMQNFAAEIGMKGLGYIKVSENGEFSGPINKFIPDEKREEILLRTNLQNNGVLYFIADTKENAPKFAGQIRTELGKRLNLIDENRYEFCYIVDYPMYELDEETGKIIFTHNPFSMPQGGLEALENKNPLNILAYQYDIVCNGFELSSGAVRNHDPEIMLKAFEIAGYTENDLKEKFGALYNAFKFGAPPHAGMAPGIERIVMLLTGDENIREITPFPMNSNAQDLLLGAPNEVSEQQLREAHIKVR